MLAATIVLLRPDGPQGKLERRESDSGAFDRLESGEPPIHHGYQWIHGHRTRYLYERVGFYPIHNKDTSVFPTT